LAREFELAYHGYRTRAGRAQERRRWRHSRARDDEVNPRKRLRIFRAEMKIALGQSVARDIDARIGEN
jgi:hypothetical protein